MRRFSSTMPTRPRIGRTRRRVVFCAETLESRQLLSVAAFQPALGPVANVPAAVGPVVPSPSVNVGATGATPVIPIVLEFNPVITGGNSFHSFVETIILVVEPVSSGFGASAATATGGSISSSGVGNVSSPTSASQNAPAPAITPLTATILAGPGSGNRVAIVAVLTQQTFVTNLGSSTIPVTTQAILATAALEEQPIQPPVLGQGFESGQTQGGETQAEKGLNLPKTPVPLEPQFPAVDFIEPFRVEPVNPPAVPPAQPAEPPAAPAPTPIKVEPVDTLPVEPTAISEVNRSPEFPILPPQTDALSEAAAPTWSMAAIIGTAAIASGGYHLVLGGSNRFNQRWLPIQRSWKENRSRKPTLV